MRRTGDGSSSPARSRASRPIPTIPTRGSGIPPGASFEAACAALGLNSGTIAVIGGPQVFTLFLKLGYDCFHMSRAVKVRLPGGLPVFSREFRRRPRRRAGRRRPEAPAAANGSRTG